MADLKSFNPDLLIAAVNNAADAGIAAIREQAAMLKVAADTIALNGIIAGAAAAHLKDFIVDAHEHAFRTSFAVRGVPGARGFGAGEIEFSTAPIDLAPGKYRVLIIITKVEEVPK